MGQHVCHRQVRKQEKDGCRCRLKNEVSPSTTDLCAGVTGLAAYFYLGGSPAPFSSTSKPKTKPRKYPRWTPTISSMSISNPSSPTITIPRASPLSCPTVARRSRPLPLSSSCARPRAVKAHPWIIRAIWPFAHTCPFRAQIMRASELVLLIKRYENGVISKYVYE